MRTYMKEGRVLVPEEHKTELPRAWILIVQTPRVLRQTKDLQAAVANDDYIYAELDGEVLSRMQLESDTRSCTDVADLTVEILQEEYQDDRSS